MSVAKSLSDLLSEFSDLLFVWKCVDSGDPWARRSRWANTTQAGRSSHLRLHEGSLTTFTDSDCWECGLRYDAAQHLIRMRVHAPKIEIFRYNYVSDVMHSPIMTQLQHRRVMATTRISSLVALLLIGSAPSIAQTTTVSAPMWNDRSLRKARPHVTTV